VYGTINGNGTLFEDRFGNTFEKRQFYVATRHIKRGEEILDFYKIGAGTENTPEVRAKAWASKGGVSHDIHDLLMQARSRAQ
jgi:hypothetical protein